MAKRAAKTNPPSKPPVSGANRVHFRLLWRVIEFEGEGMTAVIGCLALGVVLVGWLVLTR
jgi:hypothetical protein